MSNDSGRVVKKRLYRIANFAEINEYALSTTGRKAFASFVSDRHWDEFLKWYEDQFGVLPPGVVAEESYIYIPCEGGEQR